MIQELTKPQVCVLVRGDLELWIDADKRIALETELQTAGRFIKISGQTINTFEILGIFSPEAMEEKNRRRSRQWKCKLSTWHDKGQPCHCRHTKGFEIRIVDGKEVEIPIYAD